MLLFHGKQCVDICLKGHNEYVRLAVEDLRRDFERVSSGCVKPRIIDEESDCCIVIEDNTTENCEPIKDEGFIIKSEGNKIRIMADGYLGSMWGIYTFCEKYLGVAPCYLFNDMEIEKVDSLTVPSIHIEDKPKSYGFRGVFINDEDLLTGWKDGGGIRDIDSRFYTLTVDEMVMDMVVETILRLKLNLVIPASFLDIDNPPEKLLADCVAKRGIFLSQHHVEPLGLSYYTLERYCKRFQKKGEFSYIQYPGLMEEAWSYYAKKWAEYDHVVWQIGLRGKLDRPVWEDDIPNEEELREFGEFISSAMEKQKQIILEATEGKAKYYTSTLWMEGSALVEKGFLRFPENTIMVFADTGPNQMYGADYYDVPRFESIPSGIYYHLQYNCCGPHLAPQTGLDKLYYNLKLAMDKGDDAYCIINASNVREFVFELHAYAQILWDAGGFSKDEYMKQYCLAYGEFAEKAEALIKRYYDDMPEIDVHYLSRHHAKYFNYDFKHNPKDIKNFIVKDGNVLEHGRDLLSNFHNRKEIPLDVEFYHALKKVLPKYIEICDALRQLADDLPAAMKKHVEVKWLCYAMTLRYIYEWYVNSYEAKQYRREGSSEQMKKSLYAACESLEAYLDYRKCAEYGIFENWYRGDLKMDVKQRLYATRSLLGQTE